LCATRSSMKESLTKTRVNTPEPAPWPTPQRVPGVQLCHHLLDNHSPSWSNSESLRGSSRRSDSSWCNYARRSSRSSGVAMTVARPDVWLARSTAASTMTTAVMVYHSSLGRARTLLPQQSSSDRCPNHRPRKDSEPMRSCAPFSSEL
jgi:hypothetical protein